MATGRTSWKYALPGERARPGSGSPPGPRGTRPPARRSGRSSGRSEAEPVHRQRDEHEQDPDADRRRRSSGSGPIGHVDPVRTAPGSAGRPCATLRSTFHARAGAVPGDWPRLAAGPSEARERRRGRPGRREPLARSSWSSRSGSPSDSSSHTCFPGPGSGSTSTAFQAWAGDLATNGPGRRSTSAPSSTTTRRATCTSCGSSARSGSALGGVGVDLIKIPPILADLADRLAGLVDGPRARWARQRSRSPRRSSLLNPVSWFDSVVWGQVDSFGVVFLLLGLRELWRDRPGAGGDLHGGRRRHQAAARHPRPASWRVVTIRRALWPVRIRMRRRSEPTSPSRAEAEPARPVPSLGAADRPPDPDPDHRARRRRDHGVLLCLPFGLSVVEVTSTRRSSSPGCSTRSSRPRAGTRT